MLVTRGKSLICSEIPVGTETIASYGELHLPPTKMPDALRDIFIGDREQTKSDFENCVSWVING